MDLFHQHALLIAVAIPVVAIVGLNLFLWWGGERGTLLLPTSPARAWAESKAGEMPAVVPVDETPAPACARAPLAAANEPHARQAA